MISPKQRALADWLAAVLAHYEITAYAFAKRSGVSKQQIGRYLKPEDGGSMPKLETLTAMSNAAPAIPLPAEFLPPSPTVNAAADTQDDLMSVPANECPPLVPGRAQTVFRLASRALELPPYAYLPGDYVLIDAALEPRAGQVVMATTANFQGRSETVLRAYQPPFLVTATADPAVPRAPIYVDDARVKILGTVVASARCFKNKSAA